MKKWNLRILVSVFLFVSGVSQSQADIFEWAYVNPSDPTQGVYQSSVVCPGGSGVSADPFADLSRRNLTQAYLLGADLYDANLFGADLYDANLTSAYLYGANLGDAGFINANLTGAYLRSSTFVGATLTNANFGGAIVEGASFDGTTYTGFTPSQLYSTASYASGDLTGIYLGHNNLTGWNFANQKLANVSFEAATLTNANFSGAIVNGTKFYATTPTGFIASQLYSTASYVSGDLTYIQLAGNDLTGWNFANQNLTGAFFFASGYLGANLNNTNFANANLTYASFGVSPLSNANFSGADVRGASGWSPDASTITHNTIRPDGSIQGMALLAGEKLVIRNNPTAITVTTSATIDNAATLQFLLDAGWTSPVGFGPGLTPTLGGTLDLGIAKGVDPSTLFGNTFQLFNWNGPLPANDRFSTITAEAGLNFDLSNLYTTGAVTLISQSPETWNYNGSGNFSDGGKWSQTVPNGTGFIAVFGGGATTSVNVPALSMTIDGAVSAGTLRFNSPTTSYTLATDGVVGHGLVLDNNGVGGSVDVSAGNHAISADLTLADSAGTTFTIAQGSTLTLSGAVRVSGTSPTVTLNGSGTLAIASPPTLPANTVILVNGGNLKFNAASGPANVGSGVTVTVAPDATLELAGSVSALANGPNRANITNDSTAPGVAVSGTGQVVGDIDGIGDTVVNAGSDLTANHIIQNALVIGGTAGRPALVIIDASDATGNPLGQSSGLALAGSLTPSGPFGAGGISSANLSSGAGGDPAAASPGNSVGGSNPSSVPEPSTLMLTLLAILGVVSTQFMRHHVRCQTV